jgi:cell division protein FtsZ
VTVIAAGFDGGEPQKYREPSQRAQAAAPGDGPAIAPSGGEPEPERVGTLGEVPRQGGTPVPAPVARPSGDSLDELDVPDFMK